MPTLDCYDGIIFDYGGVLVFDQNERDIQRLAALTGVEPARFGERYWRRRLELDSDALPIPEYWRDVAGDAGTLSDERIAELSKLDTESWMRYDPVMWEWLEELRASGKRIAILSNMPRDLGSRLRSETDRLSYFDHVTLSYEIRSVKPHTAIYEHCLAGLATPPERTLFLDDRVINVEAARKLGIASVQFTSREEVLPTLRG